VAAGGIVIGGGRADHVVVAGNDLVGVAEAVHVGVSVRKDRDTRWAERVEIRGNRAVMRVPVELKQGPRAYFVGNVRHGVVADNEMRVEAGSFMEGVRVWGELGPLVRVDDNLLAGCALGVRFQNVQPSGRARLSASGNVAPDAGEVCVLASADVQVAPDNVP
jgi:hypothetical protein